MTLSLPGTSSSNSVKVGNDAGWLLSFHKEDPYQVVEKPELEFGRDDYYGDIEATLPGDLTGGTYTFTIHGLTDKHYGQITLANAGNPAIIRLYLYWRDTLPGLLNGIGAFVQPVAALADTLGPSKSDQLKQFLVAELHTKSVSRKAGARRYETTIVATERMYDLLSTRAYVDQTKGPIDASDFETAIKNLLLLTSSLEENTDFFFYDPKPNAKTPPATPSSTSTAKSNLALDRPVLTLLGDLGKRMEQKSGSYGRGMYLIRNGKLHAGKRPIPLGDGQSQGSRKPLTPRNGLIEVEVLKPVFTDPGFKASPGNDPPKQNQYRLTLKGRPDLKPGDLVMFDVATEDLSSTKPALAGLVGSLADMVTGPLIPTLSDDVTNDAVLMYVSSVQHKLGKDTGFVTIVSGVGVGTKQSPADDSNADVYWDGRTVATSAKAKLAQASAESQLGQAVQDVIDQALGQAAQVEVGEVRAADASQQTERVWRGLVDGAGESYQARSLEIARPSPGDVPEAPYLTPFAWSKCGLILPRYPGTRVLLEHRQGASADPVDIGALWSAADLPSNVQAGDWWLILPANASPTDQFASDTDKPKSYSDVATHDLIDAGGNRVIEVGALTIRVGKSNLTKAGTRPAAATADSISIEHKGRAVISVDSSGNITIDAGSNNLNLNAKNVNVKVSGTMNVSG